MQLKFLIHFDFSALLKKQKYVSGYVLGRPFSSVKGFVWNNRCVHFKQLTIIIHCYLSMMNNDIQQLSFLS